MANSTGSLMKKVGRNSKRCAHYIEQAQLKIYKAAAIYNTRFEPSIQFGVQPGRYLVIIRKRCNSMRRTETPNGKMLSSRNCPASSPSTLSRIVDTTA
jgi:hypothetical protein